MSASTPEGAIFRTFIPLPNFLPGDQDYENTCFIVATLNLSAWLPSIQTALFPQYQQPSQWNNQLWQVLIKRIRYFWNFKYQWTPESRGQDDAAELLGDILWNMRPGNFGIISSRYMHTLTCNHHWQIRALQMMAVLSLPPRIELVVAAFERIYIRGTCGKKKRATLFHTSIADYLKYLDT